MQALRREGMPRGSLGISKMRRAGSIRRLGPQLKKDLPDYYREADHWTDAVMMLQTSYTPCDTSLVLPCQ